MSERRFEFYPSTKSLLGTHEGTILLLPGLLGERTMQESVAIPLANEGFNTMVVSHSRRTGLHVCNLARSIDVHRAALQAIEETHGSKTIHVIGHSKGAEDAANFMQFTNDPPEVKDIPYVIHGFGSIAGVGRNDFNPGLLDVWKEFYQHKTEIMKNIHGEVSVLRASLGSLIRNPLLAMFEGLSASRADTSELLASLAIKKAFITEYELYGEADRLVPKPKDRVTETYDGHHMTPVYRPDIAIEVAKKITQ